MNASLNRRSFLRATSALAVTGLNAAGVAAAGPLAKKRDIKKAIMYGTIGYKGSVLEKLKAAKEAGFEGVEPVSQMNQDEVMKALDATGLKAASVCCATHWGKPLSHPETSVREEGLAGLLQTLRDAKRYGATSVLLVPGVVNKEVTYDDCWKRSVAEIRKAIPEAEKLGVKIAVENVWNNFITKPEQAMEFLDAIGSPLVGWHFDVGNVIRYSPPETWIPVLGKRIIKLHIKEFSKARQFGVKLLEGDNNWPAIMKTIDDVGYRGWGITEQPGDQTRDAAGLKDMMDRLDRIFAG